MYSKKEELIYLFKKMDKLIREDLDNTLKVYDITSTQGRIIFFINHQTNVLHNEIHQCDIENEFQLTKSTVSGFIDRLENKNLVTRKKNNSRTIIELTARAHELIEHVVKARQDLVNKISTDIRDEDLSKLDETIRKMITNIQGGYKNA